MTYPYTRRDIRLKIDWKYQKYSQGNRSVAIINYTKNHLTLGEDYKLNMYGEYLYTTRALTKMKAYFKRTPSENRLRTIKKNEKNTRR